ncbi:MAG: M4 family metallopeptidase, partial [Parcubacteria group bacterium]|nr:M4 family metallopeptidase [Parcubacteria group bacterium]
ENKPDGNNHLVWEVDLYLEKPNEHEYYFIDAKSGDLIHQITGIQQAVDREIWDCSLGLFTGDCYLDTSWAGYTYGRSEGQLARGTNPLVGGTDTDDLYNYTGSLHNYYANKFSRNGANNQGGMGDGAANFPVATTSGLTFIDYHFLDPNDSGSCPNAFFNSANSIRFCEGYVTSDIVGHEYAHAVNFFTIQSAAGNPAGLTYRNESGALNENNSDVFGEAFEYYYEGSNNWEIGEDLSGGASRSMEDPTKYNYNFGTSTPYPDRFHSSNYYCGTQDGGGVHINSSVPNKAAYLLAIGGTFNGCTVSGIGRTKEEAIFYRAQTNYYTTSTDFNGAYNALISACGDLYGATSSDCVATRKALQAVEMDQAGACSSTARVAPICADGTTPSVSNASPAHGTKTIARDSNISFEIDDSASGIDSDSLSVTVDGRTAISGGALQSGYSGSIDSDSEGGYDVAINPGSDFDNGQSVTMVVEAEDNNGNSVLSTWSFTTININSKILTTSGPGEVTRLQAYDRRGNSTGDEVSDLFPTSYTGGAGIVPIDANSNGLKDQFLIFAASNGGPQARVMGLREDGSQYFRGQMFVFDSTIRDGLSMTTGDFDNDGYEDDVAACLTGDKAPTVRVYKDATGMDNWEKIGEFTAPFGDVGCNVGTFQYDTGAPEILVAPHHGPAEPNVYIYTAGGTLKKSFAAYGAGVTSGLTPSGIEDRIYTTPNNGSSHIMAYDRNGVRKNFWWAYAQHVRGDFKNVPGDIDLDGKDEILISPVGSNGPHVLGFEASGRQRTWPNFFAFGDETLRNGVGIAVIDNWHGVN